MVEALRTDFSVRQICETLGFTRSNLYYHPMQRGVQITQAFRNEIGKAVKTKRLTTRRTQKAFALEVGTTATTLRNIEMGLSLVSPPLLKRVVEATGLPFNPSKK